MKPVILCACAVFMQLLTMAGVGAQEVLLPLLKGADKTCRLVTDGKKTASSRILFRDDFSAYLGRPDSCRWELSGAVVNRGFDLYPPTIGMVTLDAADMHGRLYSSQSGERFAADTLCSRVVRLDSLLDGAMSAFSTSDSLALEFYYLPGGGMGNMWQRVGMCPGEQDSLLLEFWNATLQKWQTVWGRAGVPQDSLLAQTGHRWQRVVVNISDTAYLSSEFRFRFRNFCSFEDNQELGYIGNTDQWMLDAISLSYGYRQSEESMRDVAFVSVPTSFLAEFQAMPFRQFSSDDMASHVNVCIANRFDFPIATRYSYVVRDEEGELVGSYDGGYSNVPPFMPEETYQRDPSHATPPVTFTFPTMVRSKRFTVRHELIDGLGGDLFPENDVVVSEQVFDDYYAYDDGSPEHRYGIIAAQSSLAVMFPLRVGDTLVAIDMYFNHSISDENASIPFMLTVWADNGGKPGVVLYSDDSYRYPDESRMGTFCRYMLNAPLPVSGTVFIGLIQPTQGYLNIGFDQNNDNHQRTFYSVGSGWYNTVYFGAVMLRPVFSDAPMLSVQSPVPTPVIRLYPNPVAERLILNYSFDNSSPCNARLYNAVGSLVADWPVCPDVDNSLDVAHLAPGLYLLHIQDRSGTVCVTRKIQVVRR